MELDGHDVGCSTVSEGYTIWRGSVQFQIRLNTFPC